MKRLILALPLLIFAVIGVVAVVMLNASSSGDRDSRAIGFRCRGEPAHISMTALTSPANDGIINLADYKGQVFAINVFASWCAPQA